jgi:hypothetical protein
MYMDVVSEKSRRNMLKNIDRSLFSFRREYVALKENEAYWDWKKESTFGNDLSLTSIWNIIWLKIQGPPCDTHKLTRNPPNKINDMMNKIENWTRYREKISLAIKNHERILLTEKDFWLVEKPDMSSPCKGKVNGHDTRI